MQDMVMYRFESFWATYDQEVHYICWICIYLYLIMYILNIFWFHKILWGTLKALGLDKAIEATENKFKDHSEEYPEEAEEEIK